MPSPLSFVYGSLFVVRPPVPVTLNKAGANYKSEVKHLEYSPRQAYDEWLGICEGILAFGGDALFENEAADAPFLDHEELVVRADGSITPPGSTEALGQADDVLTGRVFSANGPWVVVDQKKLRAIMPNMLAHRVRETPYYRGLLEGIAQDCRLELEIADNPHRWEGMADVAVVGERVVLTYTVRGHYDEGIDEKSMRSCREGVTAAADFVGVPAEARVYAELVYPHFHGDTVHFGARPPAGPPKLVHFEGGLYRGQAERVASALSDGAVVRIDRNDAVEQYAGNSRQVAGGVLVPDGVSGAFVQSLEAMGLKTQRVRLFELFGKAGGGPACATLYLPKNLELPARSRLRYSVRRDEAKQYRARVPTKVTVDRGYFEDRKRG